MKASAKQLAFQRKFFARKDDDGRRLRVLAALGANRSGKSIVAGRLCFAKYLRDHARNGDRFWCVTVTFEKSVSGQQKELWDALPHWMFGDQIWSEKTGFSHRKILLPTSDGGHCLVEFKSADQDASTFEQAKLRGVWIDEQVPEEIYARLIPRTIDLSGFILISDIPGSWWHHERLIEAKPEAGVLYQHFEMADNRHNLPENAIEEAAALMSEDDKKLRILGLMVIMEGIVYREFIDRPAKQGGHLKKRFRIPDDWPKWRMIDYGASAPTACLWAAIAPTEDIYLYRTHYVKGLSVAKNAEMIIGSSGHELYRETLIDPHAKDKPPVTYGVAKTISRQYAEAGIETKGWPYVNVMGEHAMVNRVKFRLENHTIWVFDDLVDLRRELRSWKYKCDKEGKPVAADAYENDNNHLLDCLKGFLGTNPGFAPTAIRVHV